MRKDVIKRVIYRYGYDRVREAVMEIKDKDTLSKDKRNELEELFGSEFDLSDVQFNSWYRKFKDEENVVSPHAINRFIRELGTPLEEFLRREYWDLKKSTKRIANEINSEYGYNVTKDQVGTWMRKCGLETRTIQESASLRWEDPDEVKKAREKTLAYFETPEGKQRKIELSKWNAEVWGKRYATSKLETRFAEEFLSDVEYKSQKQFRLPDKKLIVADFFVDGKVIEVNGDYWHAHPERYPVVRDTRVLHRLERDNLKHQYYVDNNLPVVYVWENDIKRNPELVEKYLGDFLNGDEVPLNSYDYH